MNLRPFEIENLIAGYARGIHEASEARRRNSKHEDFPQNLNKKILLDDIERMLQLAKELP